MQKGQERGRGECQGERADHRPGGRNAAADELAAADLRTEIRLSDVISVIMDLPGVVAIPGASSVEQLEFNVAAADLEVSAENRDALTAAARAFRPVSVGRSLVDMARERLGR